MSDQRHTRFDFRRHKKKSAKHNPRDIFNALFVNADGISENEHLHAGFYQNTFTPRLINSKN